MVTATLVDVVLFVVVFVYLDDASAVNASKSDSLTLWVTCLVETGGQKDKCYKYGQHWLVNESTIAAVLICFTCIGTVCFPLMFRFSFLTGWKDLLMRPFTRKQEFVSLDAMHHNQSKQYSTSTQESGYPYPQASYYQSGGTKGAVFEMQSPVNPQKDYGMDNEDATTLGSPRMHSPVESYSPPARNYSQPNPRWSRQGRTTPDAVASSIHADPYAAAPGRTTPQDPYALEQGTQTYAHPSPSLAAAQMYERDRSASPNAGQYDWAQQPTGSSSPQQYLTGNAFAQQRYR